jgi:hypothetical protein
MKIFPAKVCFYTRRTSLASKPGLKIESSPTPFVSQSMGADGRKIIYRENTALI